MAEASGVRDVQGEDEHRRSAGALHPQERVWVAGLVRIRQSSKP